MEECYYTYNRDPRYRNYPIVDYQGILQRRIGCFGAGNRFLYIDTDGSVYRCPFCREKVAQAMAFPVRDVVDLLQAEGCAMHELSPV